jgi:hypothetical protein
MPRLLTSLLVMLLGTWPARLAAASAPPRARRGRRLLARLGADDAQDPVEAPEQARARTFGAHHWPGALVFTAGERRTVVNGRWRLTVDPTERAQRTSTAAAFVLDPAHPELWQTRLEALLTVQVPGARLRVTRANADGWQWLELRAPTQPETVVQLDREAVAQLVGATPETTNVELRVFAP